MTARRALLLLALSSTGITLIWIGSQELIGYDGYWHVFIASQRSWSTFLEEVGANAHPPLYYLLLKISKALGRHPLVYRSVSILATIGCVWLVARLGNMAMRTPWPSVLATFAFGLSLNTISVGLEVRAYMLSVFFMLAAFHPYLQLAEGGFGDRALKRRMTFSVCASLALLTHYSAAFLVAACLIGPALSAIADRSFRTRLVDGLRVQGLLNVLTFGIPGLFVGLLYAHLRSGVSVLGHLPEYLFDPSSETAAGFLARSGRGMLELLLPPAHFSTPTSTLIVVGPELGAAGGAVAFFLVCIFVALLAYAVSKSASTRCVAASATLTVTIAMVCAVALSALARKYPFGGTLRHQYFLMPFALLVVFAGLDQMLQRLQQSWTRRFVIG